MITLKSSSFGWIPLVFAGLLAGACGGIAVETATSGTAGSTGTGFPPTGTGSTTGVSTTGKTTTGTTTTGAITTGAITTGSTTGSITTGTTIPVTPKRAPAQHRAVAATCKGEFAPAEPGLERIGEGSKCTKHADCTAGINGRCVSGRGSAGGYFSCEYDDCQTDNDCDSGKVCYCTPSNSPRCLSIGNCQTDSDCGSGNYCSPSMSWDCGGYRPIDGYHCHTPKDTCVDDADCTGTDYCNFNIYKNLWQCTPIDRTCAIG